MHKKNHIRNTLLKWLNEEWKAKKKGKEDNCAELPHEPFQRNTMPLIVPKGMPQRWHVTVALNRLHVAFTTPSPIPGERLRRWCLRVSVCIRSLCNEVYYFYLGSHREPIKEIDHRRTRFSIRHGRHLQDSIRDGHPDQKARGEVLYHLVEEGKTRTEETF